VLCLEVHFNENQTRFHVKSFAQRLGQKGFEKEAQGISDMTH